MAHRGGLAEAGGVPWDVEVSPKDAQAGEVHSLPAVAGIVNLFNVVNLPSAESSVREQERMDAAIAIRVDRSGNVDVHGYNAVAG
jgi:hypothetical protein